LIFTEHSTTVPSVGSKVSIFKTDLDCEKPYVKGTVIAINPNNNHFSLKIFDAVKIFHTNDIVWRWTQKDYGSIRKTKSLSNLRKLSFQEKYFKQSGEQFLSRTQPHSPKSIYKNRFSSKNRIRPI